MNPFPPEPLFGTPAAVALAVAHLEEKTMPYTRKTRDEYRLLVNYGQGWEHELTEDTFKEAREQRKCYRENCPQYPTKIVKARVRIEVAS